MKSPLRAIPIVPLAAVQQEARLQVRATTGVFNRWRWAMAWLTQLVFYGTPWLTLHGRQAVLFDLQGDRFYLWGAVLFPQDLIYLAGLLVLCAWLLFFATAVAGRVWCGFACPQTVYTALFMRIEHWCEGDRQARLRLDKAPWGARKLARRGGRHALWLALSLWTGFTFVGYFTPIRELVTALPLGLGPWEAFWVLFYGLLTYGNAGFLREKVCLHMCPYGRFQGALMDPDTLHVAYDRQRGEPRTARPRGTDPAQRGGGACVNCTLCVQVCPTGIDIRDGLQAACIACGLCIDACNRVMDQLRAPRGLIRMASARELALPAGQRPGWRGRLGRRRVWVYAGLLLLGSGFMALSFAERSTLRLNAMRDRSVLARQVEQGAVENVYRLRVMNAQERERELRVEVDGLPGAGLSSPALLRVPAAAALEQTITVRLGQAQATEHAGGILPLRLRVREANPTRAGDSAETATTFVVPR